jgi:hypothetical protein
MWITVFVYIHCTYLVAKKGQSQRVEGQGSHFLLQLTHTDP